MNHSNADPRPVLLYGANGFVGSSIAQALLNAGFDVRAANRRPPQQHQPTAQHATIDLNQPQSLVSAAQGCQATVYAVGIIRENPSTSFELAHHLGVRHALQAARQAGHHRFILISALGVRPDGCCPYIQSKHAGEQSLQSSTIPTAILRPGLIFGLQSAFLSMLVRFCEPKPWDGPLLLGMPVFGRGDARLQPVLLADLVDAVCRILQFSTHSPSAHSPATLHTAIDLPGPKPITWTELYRLVARALLGRERPILHIPPWAGRWVAHTIMKLPILPDMLRFDAGMVAMSQLDNTADTAPAETLLQRPLQDPIEWLQTVWARDRPV